MWGPLSRAHAGTFLSGVRGPCGGPAWPWCQPFSFWDFCPEEIIKHVDRSLFRTAENWQQPKCPRTDVLIEILGSFSQWNVVQLLKG